ncbi:MAG TPA: hypothetical protein VHY20_16265 [Pirellulales bacterium]|nr:hypothetical protein [Pirellulales bacterium]
MLLYLIPAFALALGADPSAEQFVPLAQQREVSVFSDRDEIKGSRTQIKAGVQDGVIEAIFQLDPQPEAGWTYAGIAIQLAGPIAADARSLRFEMRSDGKTGQPSTVTLQTGDGKRFRVDLRKYGEVEPRWTTFAIPLQDFRLDAAALGQLSSLNFKLAGTDKDEPRESLGGTISLRKIAFAGSPADSRAGLPDLSFLDSKKVKQYARGHAAWIYQESEADVARIVEYNKHAAIPIRMLLVYAGSLEFTPKGPVLSPLKTKRLAWFRSRLPADVEIHANIDSADGQQLADRSPAELERLAKQLADQANQLTSLQGLHVDLEPYLPDAAAFYIHLKKYLNKPFGAAVADWDPVLLKVLDYAVLMAYDLGRTPEAFGRSAAARYQAFAQDARAAKTFYFLGVPFVATTLEYEYSRDRRTSQQQSSGFHMEDYVAASLKAFRDHSAAIQGPYFGGIAVWGFLEERKGGVGGPNSRVGRYPQQISSSAWSMLGEFGK